MSNFISWQDLLTRLNILPFELFDHVKKGLQPFDEFGKPIPPPTITRKSERLKELKEQKDNILLEYGKIEALYRGESKEAEKRKLDIKHKSILNEIETLEKEMNNIENKYSWSNCDLQKNEKSAQRVIDLLLRSYFRKKDVEAIGIAIPELCMNKNEDSERLTTEPAPNQRKTANYFKQNGEFWILRHEGKESKPIKHVDGLLYIAHLLSNPGTSISCKDLYQSVSGNIPNKIMSEGAAIGEGLNIGGSKQAFSDHKANEAYWRQWQELQDAIDNAEDSPEGEMVKKESKKKQDELIPYLKEKTFTNPSDKKAQVNIKKRLDKAYETISKKNMKDMAKYLKNNIKPDGALGLIYTGSLIWEIIIE